MIRGSCLCGAVRFEVDEVRSITHCHCANCRKLTGAAFATYAHVEVDKFRFLAGEDMTVRYESAPGSFRYRCKICGCLTPGKASYLETVSIPAGLFDDDPKVRPRLHYLRRRVRPGGRFRTTCPSMKNGFRATSRSRSECVADRIGPR
jgi:hypothetical protein